MVFHELATNSLKYGALSQPGGRLTLRWSVNDDDDQLVLAWREKGGPTITGGPREGRFGSQLIEAIVTPQLGGRLSRRRLAEGLRCEMATLPRVRSDTAADGIGRTSEQMHLSAVPDVAAGAAGKPAH